MEQHLEQGQKLALTQAMQQSLHCLELTAPELRSYVEEAALSNPLLEIEEPCFDKENAEPELIKVEAFGGSSAAPRAEDAWQEQQHSLQDHLERQLGQMAELDDAALARCRYLVGCLSSTGYLDCALEELAQELGQSLFDMEQALFVIQDLDPPGVAARNLTECLILQLAQSKAFQEINIHLVRFGLPLLAQNDIIGLSKLLKISPAEAKQAAQTIRSLNPIPSRGFSSPAATAFVIPEARFMESDGRVKIELNSSVLPRVELNKEYRAMIDLPGLEEAQTYLKEKLTDARRLIDSLERREKTLSRILSAVASRQENYFLHRGDLAPMTIQELSEELALNNSTVSRAVKGKYILWDQHPVLLRSLFSVSLGASPQQTISPSAVKRQLRHFIENEAPALPLSDEALRQALAGVNISLARRTVAKYRDELGILPAAARKRAYQFREEDNQ